MKYLKFIVIFIMLIRLSLESSYYEEGKRAYDEKDYKRAIHYFKNSKSEYSNINMQSLWAESEKALDRVDYMMAAYERILNIEPRNFEIAYNLINLYKGYGLEKEIRKVISNFDFNDYLPQERSILVKFLTTDYMNLNKFSVNFINEIGYDSDIISYENSTNNFFELPLENSVGSPFCKTKLFTSYIYDLSNKGNWFIEADIDFIQKSNFNEAFYDLRFVRVSPKLGYKIANKIISIPIYYEYTYDLGRNLIQNYGFKPTLSTLLDSNHVFNFSLISSKKEYLPDGMDIYNSYSYGVSSSLHYIFSKLQAVVNISYLKNSAQNRTDDVLKPKYIDNKILNLAVDVKYRFRYAYMITANSKIVLKDFDEKLVLVNQINEKYLSNDKRRETYCEFGLGLSRNLSKRIKIISNFNYSINVSPYKEAEYDRIMSSIGLEYNF